MDVPGLVRVHVIEEFLVIVVLRVPLAMTVISKIVTYKKAIRYSPSPGGKCRRNRRSPIAMKQMSQSIT
jgi:hypothetical protein